MISVNMQSNRNQWNKKNIKDFQKTTFINLKANLLIELLRKEKHLKKKRRSMFPYLIWVSLLRVRDRGENPFCWERSLKKKESKKEHSLRVWDKQLKWMHFIFIYSKYHYTIDISNIPPLLYYYYYFFNNSLKWVKKKRKGKKRSNQIPNSIG